LSLRTIGGQSYIQGDTLDSQWTVQIHKLTDSEGRKFLLFETRSNDSTDGLEELFVQFAKVRHYHVSPLIAWQKVPNGYEWLLAEPAGQNLEELLVSGPLSPSLVESFMDQALTLYGAFETHQWFPQNFHPRNLWLDGSEMMFVEELEYRIESDPRLWMSTDREIPMPYLSPEEIQNTSKPDWASLEFRIGVLAYHMLTGQHPFGSGVQGIINVLTGKPEPMSEELLLRHRPLCQRILKLLRVA
jgi:serine/threonine protein kinase